MSIHLAATTESIARCFPVMQELRPLLTSAEEFIGSVEVQQREGFQLAFLEDGGDVVTVAGFRIHHKLSGGLTLYVDDLVMASSARSHGYGKAMLDWLIAYAREQGCENFSLDSGTARQDAHAFYLRERLRITAFHFQRKLI